MLELPVRPSHGQIHYNLFTVIWSCNEETELDAFLVGGIPRVFACHDVCLNFMHDMLYSIPVINWKLQKQKKRSYFLLVVQRPYVCKLSHIMDDFRLTSIVRSVPFIGICGELQEIRMHSSFGPSCVCTSCTPYHCLVNSAQTAARGWSHWTHCFVYAHTAGLAILNPLLCVCTHCRGWSHWTPGVFTLNPLYNVYCRCY